MVYKTNKQTKIRHKPQTFLHQNKHIFNSFSTLHMSNQESKCYPKKVLCWSIFIHFSHFRGGQISFSCIVMEARKSLKFETDLYGCTYRFLWFCVWQRRKGPQIRDILRGEDVNTLIFFLKSQQHLYTGLKKVLGKSDLCTSHLQCW